MYTTVTHTYSLSHTHAQVTEADLAEYFSDCGWVIDCRICGDPASATRFGFIEFQSTDAVPKVWGVQGVARCVERGVDRRPGRAIPPLTCSQPTRGLKVWGVQSVEGRPVQRRAGPAGARSSLARRRMGLPPGVGRAECGR
eukprot:356305-Chlamydomonas_euryale.AAC.3